MSSFAPLEPRARWAVVLVVIAGGWSVVAITHDLMALSGHASAGFDAALTWTGAAVLFPAAIAFLAWFGRAHANVAGLGFRLRRSTRWAVASWLVPIVWFVVPLQATNDLWRGGDPAARGDATWTDRPSSGLVYGWFAAWCAGWVVGIAATFSMAEPFDAERGWGATWHALDIALQLLWVVSTVLTVRVVRTITARLEARAAEAAA